MVRLSRLVKLDIRGTTRETNPNAEARMFETRRGKSSIEACIANARRADNGGPVYWGQRSDCPFTEYADINSALSMLGFGVPLLACPAVPSGCVESYSNS